MKPRASGAIRWPLAGRVADSLAQGAVSGSVFPPSAWVDRQRLQDRGWAGKNEFGRQGFPPARASCSSSPLSKPATRYCIILCLQPQYLGVVTGRQNPLRQVFGTPEGIDAIREVEYNGAVTGRGSLSGPEGRKGVTVHLYATANSYEPGAIAGTNWWDPPPGLDRE